MLQLLLLVLMCAFAGVVAFGTFVVLYHFQRFRLTENSHRMRIVVFLVGSAILIWLEISLGNSIAWQDVFNGIIDNRLMF